MAFLFSAFLVSSILQAQAAAPIVGGDEVIASDVYATSTVALLTLSDGGVGICTGSLIATDLLITAAHCVSDRFGGAYPGQRMFVIFNVGVSAGIEERRRVIAAVPHPNYRGAFSSGRDQNDIAVVRFVDGLPTGYQAATLLPATYPLTKGTSTTLIGYGVNTMNPETGGEGSGTLRKVTVKIGDAKFAKTEILLDQRAGKGACHGDSGGPATVSIGGKIYLWGVTNRGYPENAPDDCKQFSVYTRINAHQKFVQQSSTYLKNLNAS